jgi:hypothetical protein
VYQFSRSIYRALAPRVLEDYDDPGGVARRKCVRDACEAAMLRLARDHRYFAHPARSLFREVRRHFALEDQLWVYRLIDQQISMALAYVSTLPAATNAFGESRECRASTRRGSQCRREPLPGGDYCPSHKHLEEPAEPVVDADGGPRMQPSEIVAA